MTFDQVPIFHVDLTLTDDCNFSCKYCFERGNFNTHKFKDVDLFFSRIDELLASSFFNKNYKLLNIGFWGGEPTLNPEVMDVVVKRYSRENRVKFFLFSNGYDIDSILDLVISHKDQYLMGGHPKFCVQISYDGMPVHDIDRTLRGGKLTSSIVRSNILRLDSLGIPSTIKATITPATFKYLHLAYEDIRDIWHRNESTRHFRANRFFPTIDYHNLEKYTDTELEISKKELEGSLIKIANREIDFFHKYNRFFFAWFNNNKAICSAGKDMVTVDWDGLVYKCHGCVYEDEKTQHKVSTLEDDNFVHHIELSNKMHSQDFGFLPIECQNCEVPFCLKCNVVKFTRSNKQNYLDRWRDYPIQKTLCDFYRINSNVLIAINQILKENQWR